jgi:hypothetical protein
LFAKEALDPEAGFLSIGLSSALNLQVVLLGPDDLGGSEGGDQSA